MRRVSRVKGPDIAQEREVILERLVQTYQGALLRTCYLYLRDASQAEDAVQETFLKAYRSLDFFRGESSEKTWLFSIAINTCRDMNRSSWIRHLDRRVTPEMLPDTPVPFEQKDETLVLAVMELPVRLREVILLYYYQGMNVKDISAALGIAQPSVSGRLIRARKQLRKIMERRESHA